jgi:hypothetical protein
MDKRFTALRVIGTVLKILAWISLILGLLGAVGSLIFGFSLSSQEGLLGLDLAVVYFMILYAAGESIYLFLSIEENTRRMAYLMQQQYAPHQPAYPSPPSSSAYTE